MLYALKLNTLAALALNAPGDGGASATGPGTIGLKWKNLSADETGFQIQHRYGQSRPGRLSRRELQAALFHGAAAGRTL